MQNNPNVEPLIHRIQKGDQQALNTLCQNWYPRVYRYALRFTGEVEAAKEASQLTFVSVTKSIHGLKEPAAYVGWLFRITANHCRNLHKSKRYHESDDSLKVTLMTDSNPHQRMVRSQEIQAVKDALMRIPKDQREVIILKEYEGLKFREIAGILDISENTVKARMYYGLNALKKTLKATKETYHEAS